MKLNEFLIVPFPAFNFFTIFLSFQYSWQKIKFAVDWVDKPRSDQSTNEPQPLPNKLVATQYQTMSCLVDQLRKAFYPISLDTLFSRPEWWRYFVDQFRHAF